MADNKAVDTFSQQVKTELEQADRRRKKHKRKAVLIRVLGGTCTAAVPVILGLDVASLPDTLLADIASVLGGLATILFGYEAFYGHRELWASNTSASVNLHRLKLVLEYELAKDPSLTGKVLDKLHSQFQDIVGEAATAWIGVRRSTAGQAAPGEVSAP
jgi:hypothetical protein